MDNLAVKHRIEEDNRKGDKASLGVEANAHIAESSKHGPKKQQLKKRNDANKRIRGVCWVCGKSGHVAADCRHKKGQNYNNQTNIVESVDLVAVIS